MAIQCKTRVIIWFWIQIACTFYFSNAYSFIHTLFTLTARLFRSGTKCAMLLPANFRPKNTHVAVRIEKPPHAGRQLWRVIDEMQCALSISSLHTLRIQHISLRYNRITDVGAERIATTLGTPTACNTKLLSLNLNGNNITDRGATHLANVGEMSIFFS